MAERAPFVPGLPPPPPTITSPEAEVKRAKYQHRPEQSGGLGTTLQLGSPDGEGLENTLQDTLPEPEKKELFPKGTPGTPQHVPPVLAPVPPEDVEPREHDSAGSDKPGVYGNGMYWKFLGSSFTSCIFDPKSLLDKKRLYIDLKIYYMLALHCSFKVATLLQTDQWEDSCQQRSSCNVQRQEQKTLGSRWSVWCVHSIKFSPRNICERLASDHFTVGNELAEILKKEGSFSAMEVQIKKIWQQEEENKTVGGWHTKISLAGIGWTESHV